jgi:hypothetical protein
LSFNFSSVDPRGLIPSDFAPHAYDAVYSLNMSYHALLVGLEVRVRVRVSSGSENSLA